MRAGSPQPTMAMAVGTGARARLSGLRVGVSERMYSWQLWWYQSALSWEGGVLGG